jgi:arginase family enzyme
MLGRTIIAEIPAQDDLILFTDDPHQFHYGDRSIDKDRIAAVQILINGAVIAAYVSARRGAGQGPQAITAAEPIDDRPEGIARDRWDVTIEAVDDAALVVECGSIRERVSQELARAVFDAVKRELERQDRERP